MLTRNGYKIKKNELSKEQSAKLVNDLTAKLVWCLDLVLRENNNRLNILSLWRCKTSYYVPRFYGDKTYGTVTTDTISDGLPIQISLTVLLDRQVPIQQVYLDQQGGVLSP